MVANVVDEMSFADKALGSQMVADKPPKYIDASIIPPTSVMVESLFSESDYPAFDDRRLGTSPEHIEQVMFLKKIISCGTWNSSVERSSMVLILISISTSYAIDT